MEFHQLLNGTLNAHFKMCRSKFSELGLYSGQTKILEKLVELEGCMQKELAEACEVEPATITSILPNMEKKGLIKRETKVFPSGTRALSVFLTEKGREMAEEVSRIFSETEELSFSGFTKDEKEAFLSLLSRVYENIK